MSGDKEAKTYYRIPPCPDYDVEGMESWLGDLAEEGLFLTKDGFFLGFGYFEKDTPRKVLYRLEASPTKGGLLTDADDEPDDEQMELSEAYGWEYIARRGDFYIYRSKEENVRELNTDPEVQALALKMVQKRQYNAVAECIVWGLIYFFLRIYGTVVIIAPMIYMKSWFFLFTMALVLSLVAGSIRKMVHYARLRKKLKSGEGWNRKKNWRKGAWLYPAKNIVKVLLWIFFACVLLQNLGRDVLGEEEISLMEYTKTTPFATIADFAPDMEYIRKESSYFNTVIEWSDWIAPVNYKWEEYAALYKEGELKTYGLLEINYHELKSTWLAETLADEYYRKDKHEKNFEFLYEMELGIDYAVAYVDNFHFPTVILQHGNKVMQASFHEYTKENTFSLKDWAQVLANSMKDNSVDNFPE